MATCINTNHPEFLNLVEQSGLEPAVLAAKIGVWMEENNTEAFPRLQQLNKYIIPGAALKQVDELRKLIPENIQKKSQILSGITTESTKLGAVAANRTDLEVVSIFLKQKRYNQISEKEQYDVQEWARNYLNDDFYNEKEYDKLIAQYPEESRTNFKVIDEVLAKTKLSRDEFIVDFFKDDLFEAAEIARERKMITIPSNVNREIFYQTSQASSVKKDLKKIFFEEVQGKELSESQIQNINSRLLEISKRIGDEDYRLRLSKNGNYYIAGYKNGAVTMDDYYSPYANGIFRQITSKETEKANKKLDQLLSNWAKKHGISVDTLQNLRKKFPDRFQKEALGVSDFFNGLIGLADNRKLDTMAEEISHFAIELLYNTEEGGGEQIRFFPLGTPMNIRGALDNVHKTETYLQVKEDYKNVYDKEIDFRKEALAKILAAEIVNEFQTSESLAKIDSDAKTFWQKFLATISDFFTWLDGVLGIDTFGRNDIEMSVLPLAKKILNGDILSKDDYYDLGEVQRNLGKKGWTETDVMYQLNKKPLKYKKKINTTPEAAIKTKKEFLIKARTQLIKRLKEFEQQETTKDTGPLQEQITALSNIIEKEEFNIGVASFVQDAVKELTIVENKLNEALDPNSEFEFTNDGIAKANGYVEMYEDLFKNIQNITLNDSSFSEKDRAEVKDLIANALDLIGSGKTKGTALAVLASKVNLERANTNAYGETIDPNFDPEQITEVAHTDTSKYRLAVGNFKNAANSIIRLAHKLIFESVSATKRFAANTARELFATQEVFLTKYKQTDLVEKDSTGTLTGYFARKYKYNDYYKEMNKTRQKIAEALDLRNDDGVIDVGLLDKSLLSEKELKIYDEFWKEFFENNSVKEKVPVREQKINKETGKVENFIKVKKDSTTKMIKESSLKEQQSLGWVIYNIQKTVPSSKYLNKDHIEKMKDPIYSNHYNNVIDKKREAVGKLTMKYKTDRMVYMLPGLLKSTLDKLTGMENDNSSFLTRIKNLGDEALFVDADDTEFGQLDNFNAQVVPIFFTNPLPVDRLSFDIGKSVVLFSEMAENFRNMNKVSPEIQNLQRAIGDRKYVKNKQEGPISGTQSTDYATIKNLLEHFIYGQEIKEDVAQKTLTEKSILTKAVKFLSGNRVNLTGKTFSFTKFFRQVQTYIRNNNLAFNIPTMLTGYLTGTGDKFITTQLGTYTTPESSTWARIEMAKNLPDILRQTGRLKQTNKVHLIMQDNQIVQLEKTIGESGRNPLTRAIVNNNPMYAGYAAGDYHLKGNATLAIYDNYRFYNNQFITREEFYRKKAAEKGIVYGESRRNDKAFQKEVDADWKSLKSESLYEAHEAIDGQLEVKSKYKKFVSQDLLNSVRGKVEYMTTLIDGTMSQTDKGAMSRTAYGGFLTMHRGFFFNLVDKKFRGFRRDSGDTVNFLTEEEEIGDYIATFGRNGLFAEIGSRLYNKEGLVGAFEAWDKLSPAKRRGVIRTVMDFAYMVVAGLLSSMLLKAADDDEDNGVLNFAALIGTRWALETGVVANIGELQNMLKEPVVGVRVTKELLSVYESLFNNDPYEKGMYEGKTRRGRLLIKLAPFGFRNLYEIQYPKEKLNAMKQIRGSGILYNEDSEKFDIGKYLMNFVVNNVDITEDKELSEENYNNSIDNLSEERNNINSLN